MQTPKAIFIDMDGTLLSHATKQVPKSALDALDAARKRSVLLFVATGRHMIELKLIPDFVRMSMDGYVTLNGAYCTVGERVVHKNPLDPALVQMVLDLIEQNPFPCVFCEVDAMYMNMVNDHVRRLQAILNLPLPKLADISKARSAEIYQLVAFVTKEMETFFRSNEQLKVTSWQDGGLDILSASANKWSGILQVCKHMGISVSEVAAIGDAENDIEMLSGVGFSVAMGNSPPEVRACASFVCGHIDADGFAEGMQHLLGRA